MKLQSINPANNQIIGEIEITSEDEARSAVSKARHAYESWAKLGVE